MTDENKPTKESDSQPKIRTSKNVVVAFKLNGTNYPLWARLMKVAIGSRGTYSHITGVPTPPEPGEESYLEWEETDLIVFSWIVDNMETNIIADFAHHQSAKALWDSLAITFESSADPYLIYDLEEKANKITQGELSLEAYWSHLHGLWIDIDRCQNRPISCCDKGVGQFRNYSTTKRLFKFLAGLNERYDGIRRDILKESPLPSVDAAYGWVKREATRLKVMPPASVPPPIGMNSDSSSGIGYGFGVRDHRPLPNRSNQSNPPPQTRHAASNRRGSKPDKSKLWCSHCGMQKHTRETCFQLVGYPDWWEEEKQTKGKMAIGVEGGGRNLTGVGNQEVANTQERRSESRGVQTSGGRRGEPAGGRMAEAMTVARWREEEGGAEEGKGLGCANPNPKTHSLFLNPPSFMKYQKIPHSSYICRYNPRPPENFEFSPFVSKNSFAALENLSYAFEAQNSGKTSDTGWIFDCGATDTMTYDKSDFCEF